MGLTTPVKQVGTLFVDASRETGGAARLLVQVLRRLVPPELDGPELKRCLLRMGYRSLSIIVATLEGCPAELLDEPVDLARGYAVDVGLHDHRPQRLVDASARLEQGREEGTLADLRDVQLDITGLAAVRQAVDGLRPDLVINAAAFNDVDDRQPFRPCTRFGDD